LADPLVELSLGVKGGGEPEEEAVEEEEEGTGATVTMRSGENTISGSSWLSPILSNPRTAMKMASTSLATALGVAD
jgi:hypothetical protein